MGVPKFFRFIAERYPNVISQFSGEHPPPVDNLYLDMNGIIHVCSHPNDIDATKGSVPEEEMARAMFNYIEAIFDAVQPRKSFVMCVDGVAPRAKMNQQRQRRFRAANDLIEAREVAKQQGQEVQDLDCLFDSNVITPGTPFMQRFTEHFKYLIQRKLSTDSVWGGARVIFSGHDAVGEGEHKIMEFIRRRRLEPGYNPNETHCLYGLDADLTMLALVSHEPHFMLLREVVEFKTEKERLNEKSAQERGVFKANLPGAPQFVLFHIGILKEYLQLDILHSVPALEERSIDWERVYDDFVLLCFLNGNDFLPSIPTFNIHDGIIVDMLQSYARLILDNGEYLTDGQGGIHWDNFSAVVGDLGKGELARIHAQEKDERDYQRRKAMWDRVPEAEVEHTADISEAKFKHYGKMEICPEEDRDKIEALVSLWVEGVEWVWRYYTRGVPSWKWFYHGHYAPYASDIASFNLPQMASKVRFELGKPFLPYQQLLGVLPPLSIRRCLPPYFHTLATREDSPLAYAFPKHLMIDREHARAPWEGIVLMPFFLEEDIVKATDDYFKHHETAEEAKVNQSRNKLAEHRVFWYDPTYDGHPVKATVPGLPDLPTCRVRCADLPYPDVPPHRLALLPGVRVGMMVGFHTFAPKTRLTVKVKDGVSIFGRPSRKPSLFLQIPRKAATAAQWVHLLKHRTVWAGWPHLRYAKVVSLVDKDESHYLVGKDEVRVQRHNAEDAREFEEFAKRHEDALSKKCGIDLRVEVLAFVRILNGLACHSGKIGPRLSCAELMFPVQLLEEKYDPIPTPVMEAAGSKRDIADYGKGAPLLFAPRPSLEVYETACGWRKHPDGNTKIEAEIIQRAFGAVGTIKKTPTENDVKLEVRITCPRPPPPLPADLREALTTKGWISMSELAGKVGVSSSCLQIICGSVCTSRNFGNKELGLGIAIREKHTFLARQGFTKRQQKKAAMTSIEGVDISHYLNYGSGHCGLTKVAERKGRGRGPPSLPEGADRGVWLFSPTAADIVQQYCTKFKPIVQVFSSGNSQGAVDFDPQFLRIGRWTKVLAVDIIKEIETWVQSQPHWKVSLIDAADDALPDSLVQRVEAELESGLKERKRVTLGMVSIYDVYLPVLRFRENVLTLNSPLIRCIDEPIRIGARVINMRNTGPVRLGDQGTVIRILSNGGVVEVLMDEEFPGGTTLNGRLRTHRGALIRKVHLLTTPSSPDTSKILPTEEVVESAGQFRAHVAQASIVETPVEDVMSPGSPSPPASPTLPSHPVSTEVTVPHPDHKSFAPPPPPKHSVSTTTYTMGLPPNVGSALGVPENMWTQRKSRGMQSPPPQGERSLSPSSQPMGDEAFRKFLADEERGIMSMQPRSGKPARRDVWCKMATEGLRKASSGS